MLRSFQELLDLTSTAPDDWPVDDEDHEWFVGPMNKFFQEKGEALVQANLPMDKELWRQTVKLL